MSIQTECDGKVKHASRISAEMYLGTGTKTEGQSIYKCRFCKKFHVGTKKKSKNVNNSKHKKNQQLDKLFQEPIIKIKKMRY